MESPMTSSAWETDTNNMFDIFTLSPLPNKSFGFHGFEIYLMTLKCIVGLQIIISILGLLANAATIRTFLRLGFNDDFTVTLFNLAIADFIFLFFSALRTSSIICFIIGEEFDINLPLVYHRLNTVEISMSNFYSHSSIKLLTAFLALMQYLCVAIPFRFKRVFTKTKTFFAIMLIWMYCLLPLFSHFGMDVRPIETKSNRTVFLSVIKPGFEVFRLTLRYTHSGYLTIFCQVIAFFSLIARSRALNRSMQYRQNVVDVACSVPSHQVDRPVYTTGASQGGRGSNLSVNPQVFGLKEKLVTVQVTIVTAIFILTGLLRLMVTVASHLDPEFFPFRMHHYVFLSISDIMSFLEAVNSTVNFFVYYKFNTKFRRCLPKALRIFKCLEW